MDKDTRGKEGVGILIHKEFEQSILNYRFVSEPIMVLSLKMQNVILNVFSIHAPEEGKPKPEREEFYDLFQREVDNVPSK